MKTEFVSKILLGIVFLIYFIYLRARHPSCNCAFFVLAGNWYFEVKLTDLPEGAATRIGWAQKNANLQAPLGFDKFGYSCRLEMSRLFMLEICIARLRR